MGLLRQVPIAELCAEGLVDQADQRLMAADGYGLERLVGQLYEERSRLGMGDYPLTSPIQGWWDRSGDTEINLVSLDEFSKRLRLGSCKRSELALIRDLACCTRYMRRNGD